MVDKNTGGGIALLPQSQYEVLYNLCMVYLHTILIKQSKREWEVTEFKLYACMFWFAVYSVDLIILRNQTFIFQTPTTH